VPLAAGGVGSALLDDITIAEAARRFRRHELSPRELTESTLAEIDSRNPVVNALTTVTVTRAIEDADRATAELRAGHDRGPLHGIPVSLKDNIDVAGVRTTAGSRLYAERIPDTDSAVARALRAAGAVLIGKANLHELALGVETTNAFFGQTRNPRDLDRIPGGSSGGSAAAVASGMGLASIGTDSGGSIRIPAALCGVVGLKPTYGRVSNAGVRVNYPSFDCAGPIARTVEDCALVLAAIAGYDADDFATVPMPPPAFTPALDADLAGIHVGVTRGYFFEQLDPEVERSVLAAIDRLGELGATVRDVEVEGLDAAWARDAARPELGHRYAAEVRDHPDAFDPSVLRKLRAALAPSLAQHLSARRESERVAAAFRRALDGVHLVAVPTTPIPAPRIGTATINRAGSPVDLEEVLISFTRVFNLLRVPALSLPCGETSNGLPVGLQLVGRPFDEAMLVRVGRAYEHARPRRAAPELMTNPH
jgi:aspartyl-tRNA(Asn)/glutamyl-tRNA(Gln) amidotransferase subunit A